MRGDICLDRYFVLFNGIGYFKIYSSVSVDESVLNLKYYNYCNKIFKLFNF